MLLRKWPFCHPQAGGQSCAHGLGCGLALVLLCTLTGFIRLKHSEETEAGEMGGTVEEGPGWESQTSYSSRYRLPAGLPALPEALKTAAAQAPSPEVLH